MMIYIYFKDMYTVTFDPFLFGVFVVSHFLHIQLLNYTAFKSELISVK